MVGIVSPTNSCWNPRQETQIKLSLETRKLRRTRSAGQVLAHCNPHPLYKGEVRIQTCRKSRWGQEERAVCKPRTGANNSADLMAGFHNPVLWREQTKLGFGILQGQYQQVNTRIAKIHVFWILWCFQPLLWSYTTSGSFLLFSWGLWFDVLEVFHPQLQPSLYSPSSSSLACWVISSSPSFSVSLSVWALMCLLHLFKEFCFIL